MFMSEFIFRGITRFWSARERRRSAGSSEEGSEAETGADVEDFRRKEGAAVPSARPGRSDSAAAKIILPFGNPAESEVLTGTLTPVALRPTLARGVPLSVEFQKRLRGSQYIQAQPRAFQKWPLLFRPRVMVAEACHDRQ